MLSCNGSLAPTIPPEFHPRFAAYLFSIHFRPPTPFLSLQSTACKLIRRGKHATRTEARARNMLANGVFRLVKSRMDGGLNASC